MSDPSRNVNGYHPIDKRTLTRSHDVRQIARERALRTGHPRSRRGKTGPAQKRWHRGRNKRPQYRKANRVTDSALGVIYRTALTNLQAAIGVPQSGAGVARSLLCSPESAISVGSLGSHASTRPEPPEIDEDRRLVGLAPHRDRWSARAALFAGCYRPAGCLLGCKCEACAPDRRRRYALARVESLKKRMRPRLLACGLEKIPIACGCGRGQALVRCRQWWLCPSCQVARAAERQPRIREGLLVAHADAVRAWGRDGAHGMRPAMVLVTITARHSGDLAADRKRLTEGWRAFYKSMHAEWGKFPYVGFWEITPGRCGSCSGYAELKKNSPRKRCQCAHPKPEGHLHCHIVAVWQFRDYEKVKSMWRAATHDASYINIAAKRRDGRPTSATSAAGYLAKYVSKGVQGGGFTPSLRADVSATMYNSHGFMTSQKFWHPKNKHRETCKRDCAFTSGCCRKCDLRVRRVQPMPAEVYDRIPAEERYYLSRMWDPVRDSPAHPDAALTYKPGDKEWGVTWST